MDSNDLRVFEAVARLGGMSRAAETLNTVQSNVTARIRALEDVLGQSLFDRHSRGVALTPAGRRLLPYAERIGRLLAEAAHAARDDGSPTGSLVIGALESTAALRLSPLLAAYVRAWPEVDLSLRTGTSAWLIDAVLQHELEGAFVCSPVAHADLETESVFREELVVMTAETVAGLDDVVATTGLRIAVLRAGCAYRHRLEGALARRGVVAPRILEFGTLETVVASVAAGLAVTLLPRALIGPVVQGRSVALHPLPPDEAAVETLFVRRRDARCSSALAAFLALVRSRRSTDRSGDIAAE